MLLSSLWVRDPVLVRVSGCGPTYIFLGSGAARVSNCAAFVLALGKSTCHYAIMLLLPER